MTHDEVAVSGYLSFSRYFVSISETDAADEDDHTNKYVYHTRPSVVLDVLQRLVIPLY